MARCPGHPARRPRRRCLLPALLVPPVQRPPGPAWGALRAVGGGSSARTWGEGDSGKERHPSPLGSRGSFVDDLSLQFGFRLSPLALGLSRLRWTGDGTPRAPLRTRLRGRLGYLLFFLRAGSALGCLVNNLALKIGETLSCALLLFNTSNLKGSGADTLGPFVRYFGSSKARCVCSVPSSLNLSIAANKCAL